MVDIAQHDYAMVIIRELKKKTTETGLIVRKFSKRNGFIEPLKKARSTLFFALLDKRFDLFFEFIRIALKKVFFKIKKTI